MHIFLCDFLLDIAQNSLEAEAEKVIINIDETSSYISFEIIDNGKGMSPEVIRRVKDPFYTDGIKHKKRKVGLGIPFLNQATKDLKIDSSVGKGTTIQYGFDLTDIDCMPLGNLSLALLAIFTGNCKEDCNILVHRSLNTVKGKREYKISRKELIDVLGDLNTIESLSLAKQFLVSKEDEIDQVRVENRLNILSDKGE